MSTSPSVFAAFDQSEQNPAVLLPQMAEHFRTSRQPLELFEALKMQIRFELGLPVVASENEPRPAEELDRQLENGLVAACTEVGSMLLEEGRIREGWMYLRPTGNSQRAAELLGNIPVTDENADDLVQVLLHEGVDVARGFQLVLDRQGTCNSITLYDQAIAGRSKSERQETAALLLDHLYDELLESVRADVARRDKQPASDEENLAELIEARRWLLDEGAYHLDTSHLSSVVRFARVLEEPAQLQKAWELTQYGKRLHHQLQYPGEEPFVDFYPAHSAFFGARLGKQVDSSLALFERKARTCDAAEQGTSAIETYVDLLDRIGRPQAAMEAAIELVPADVPAARLTPLLLELAQKAENFQPVYDYCQSQDDVLGYVTARTVEAQTASKPA